MKRLIAILTIFLSLSSLSYAEIPTLKDVKVSLPGSLGEISFYGSNRFRAYFWDYFSSTTDNDYTHTANQLRLGSQLENEYFLVNAAFQHTEILHLPSGTSPGAGTGNLYRGNGDGTNDPHGTYLKYLHLDVKDIFDIGLTGSVGRFDFSNAGSYKGENSKINWVQSKRVSQRVIGGFGWSEFQRSFDGAKVFLDTDQLHLTAASFSPTQGGFEERAGRLIDEIDVVATELTIKEDVLLPNTQIQFFNYWYNDSRIIFASTPRRDNTGRIIPALGEHDIKLNMIGAHLIGSLDMGPGQWDYLLWGGYQSGDWFELDHKAYAFAAELGYQFTDLAWKPWIRGGYNLGSGDSNSQDQDHETFYQMLPTTRLYSWSILYNMMNNEDAFVMLILKPHPKITVRSDVHFIGLEDSNDRWYLGAGPVSLNRASGYAARPSSGFDELGTMVDVGIWWKIHPQIMLSAYYGYFEGSDVVENFFTDQQHVNFGYADITIKF